MYICICIYTCKSSTMCFTTTSSWDDCVKKDSCSLYLLSAPARDACTHESLRPELPSSPETSVNIKPASTASASPSPTVPENTAPLFRKWPNSSS